MQRRTFLRGAGGVLVGLPFLESQRVKAGGAMGSPKRFVTIMHPQGTIPDAWLPAQTGNNFTLPTVLEPLAPLQDQINVLSGIDNGITNLLGAGHGVSGKTLLTAMPMLGNIQKDGSLAFSHSSQTSAAGPSIDQELAQRIGEGTPHTSVDLSIGGGTQSSLHFAGPADPVTLERSPQAAFERLFSDFEKTEAPTTIQRIRSTRASVLDAVIEDFDGLSGRVSTQDKQRLEAHAEKIRELEKMLDLAPLECDAPDVTTPEDYETNHDYDNITAPLMSELAAMSLACGLTRVATLTFSSGHTPRFPWLGENIPGEWGLWHEMIHGARDTPEGRPAMISVFQWYASAVAEFVSKLAAVDEGDGTLLDNTVVLWGSEFGDGAAHDSNDLPLVMFGGGNMGLEGGRHLAFGNQQTFGDLCASLLEMFGFPGETFGWADSTTGAIPGLV
ncbi:MAG: DUF1552 domain-containing protein [Nannocystales bacterium]